MTLEKMEQGYNYFIWFFFFFGHFPVIMKKASSLQIKSVGVQILQGIGA
jgi:hypothetical protein